MNELLEQRLADLPARPGCYRFLDGGGRVLYVGKATSLRSRVRSYFGPAGPRGRSAWIERMVGEVADVEVMVTNTPIEALMLELNLIRQHRPPYNSRLTDDKHYPYLCLTWSEEFPRLVVVRRVEPGKDQYFGPYSSARGMRRTLDMIRRVFGVRSCKLDLKEGRTQDPCLEHHLGFCPAPCAGLVTKDEYRETMRRIVRFLHGHADGVLKDLRAAMAEAAENQQYERAAEHRDQIRAIEGVVQKQDAILPDLTDHDAVGVFPALEGDVATVQILFVRAGRLVDQQAFTLRNADGRSDGELLGEFLAQYYSRAAFIPKEVLVCSEPEEMPLIAEWLSTRRGAQVDLRVPQRGEKRRLVALASENAEHSARAAHERERMERERGLARSAALRDALAAETGLEERPIRIECYDISTLQGKDSVGSMVVFVDGQPARSEYRSFIIRETDGHPDDFAMMREVLTRRFGAHRAENEAFRALPNLVVVDGGKGQLGVAVEVLEAFGLDIPVVGLAKRLEEILMPGRPQPLLLSRTDEGLKLLMHLRDEAHRFAITHHRKRRSKSTTRSILDDIPGIGAKRKAALLERFPSVRALLDATVDEVAGVPGITTRLAERIHQSLRAPGMGRSRRSERAPRPDRPGGVEDLRAEPVETPETDEEGMLDETAETDGVHGDSD